MAEDAEVFVAGSAPCAERCGSIRESFDCTVWLNIPFSRSDIHAGHRIDRDQRVLAQAGSRDDAAGVWDRRHATTARPDRGEDVASSIYLAATYLAAICRLQPTLPCPRPHHMQGANGVALSPPARPPRYTAVQGDGCELAPACRGRHHQDTAPHRRAARCRVVARAPS